MKTILVSTIAIFLGIGAAQAVDPKYQLTIDNGLINFIFTKQIMGCKHIEDADKAILSPGCIFLPLNVPLKNRYSSGTSDNIFWCVIVPNIPLNAFGCLWVHDPLDYGDFEHTRKYLSPTAIEGAAVLEFCLEHADEDTYNEAELKFLRRAKEVFPQAWPEYVQAKDAAKANHKAELDRGYEQSHNKKNTKADREDWYAFACYVQKMKSPIPVQ